MPQPSAAYRLARISNQADCNVAAAHKNWMVFLGHWSTLFMQCKVWSGTIAVRSRPRLHHRWGRNC
jgi:hypothetical protein